LGLVFAGGGVVLVRLSHGAQCAPVGATVVDGGIKDVLMDLGLKRSLWSALVRPTRARPAAVDQGRQPGAGVVLAHSWL
jgi:hypothetical protein